jgi:endonuclease/exonuclease/phosphatase family metal-dependent hydrolase
MNARLIFSLLVAAAGLSYSGGTTHAQVPEHDSETTVRFASFNVAMNRRNAGDLKRELVSGESPKTQKIAEIIQRVRPDVLLINEFDYDEAGEGLNAFREKFLGVSQNGQQPIEYPHVYAGPVNTGEDSGIDLNMDGKQRLPRDGFGFGHFPGQYALVVLSKYPFDRAKVRTFQQFLWQDMPNAELPIDPPSGEPYYTEDIMKVYRLSSKSHWDIPILAGDKTIHFLVSHPTPPVFDGEEDANGCRNHDEIRMFADYISNRADYLYDDAGDKGGLPEGSHFVIAGDLNADPKDGASRNNAIRQLTEHPFVNDTLPGSEGGTHYAKSQGQANLQHKGDPALDTGDFGDERTGNMRIDYCLPSKSLDAITSGVFWPKPDQPGGDLVDASDHRLVWVDLSK